MYQVRDWLYIADYQTAISADIMQAHGIQGMLQLFKAIELDGIDGNFIPVLENVALKPEQIQQGIEFIREQHAKKHRIVTTCGAGISRSVMFAVIALVEIEGLSMRDAFHAIHRVHSKAMPDYLHWENVSAYYGVETDFWEIWGDVTLSDIDDDASS